MDKKTFKEFCKNEFEVHGFKKQRNVFYLIGHDLLCGIDLQKSNYADVYYVNYYYFIGEFAIQQVTPPTVKAIFKEELP